jgi:hypothetical protein
LFALLAAALGQLFGFAAAFAVAPFDFPGDILLALSGFALCAFGLPLCIFLTLFADLPSFAR